MKKQKPDNLRTAYSEAIRLWEDPFDAPEVPPRVILEAFLEDPAKVGEDMAFQIKVSINALRALDVIRLERGEHPLLKDISIATDSKGPTDSELAVFSEAVQKVAKDPRLKRNKASCKPEFSQADNKKSPSPGELWLTTDEVSVYDGEKLHPFKLSIPPLALITEEAEKMPNGDFVARCVAVSPDCHWPDAWVAQDEIRVCTEDHDDYVAHIWLGYPISKEQLLRPVGKLDRDSLVSLLVSCRAKLEGLPLSERERCGSILDLKRDQHILLERERLKAYASWLGATARAKFSWFEAQPSLAKSPVFDGGDSGDGNDIEQIFRQLIAPPSRSLQPRVRGKGSLEGGHDVRLPKIVYTNARAVGGRRSINRPSILFRRTVPSLFQPTAFSLDAADGRSVPSKFVRYKVPAFDVTLRVRLQRDNIHCDFRVFDTKGDKSFVLDNAELYVNGSPSGMKVQKGRIPKIEGKDLKKGFDLVLDGKLVVIEEIK